MEYPRIYLTPKVKSPNSCLLTDSSQYLEAVGSLGRKHTDTRFWLSKQILQIKSKSGCNIQPALCQTGAHAVVEEIHGMSERRNLKFHFNFKSFILMDAIGSLHVWQFLCVGCTTGRLSALSFVASCLAVGDLRGISSRAGRSSTRPGRSDRTGDHRRIIPTKDQ